MNHTLLRLDMIIHQISNGIKFLLLFSIFEYLFIRIFCILVFGFPSDLVNQGTRE